MKKLLVAISVLSLFVPFVSFASTDDQIRASITQQLLSNFVVEVNALDKIQSLVSQSSNPSQFDSFSAQVAQQLSETSAQLSSLLRGSNSPATSSTTFDSSISSESTTTTVDLHVPLVDLKINGSDGPVIVNASNCPDGTMNCSKINLNLTIANVGECGITGPLSISGFIGGPYINTIKNTLQRTIYGSSKITLICNTSSNTSISDSVDVTVQSQIPN